MILYAREDKTDGYTIILLKEKQCLKVKETPREIKALCLTNKKTRRKHQTPLFTPTYPKHTLHKARIRKQKRTSDINQDPILSPYN